MNTRQHLLFSYDVGNLMIPVIRRKFNDDRAKNYLEIILKHLEGKASKEEIETTETLAWGLVNDVRYYINDDESDDKEVVYAVSAFHAVYNAVRWCLRSSSSNKLKYTDSELTNLINNASVVCQSLVDELLVQTQKDVVFDEQYKTPDTIGLAKEIYEIKDFSLMPILADALTDLGCHEEQVIHVRNGKGLSNWALFHLKA